ncbi:MAG: hypothetical protein JO000_29945 [Alphaproteobacteria bacterium]|nr:hypothetical protein [Alphaproteobacteria bacterium]
MAKALELAIAKLAGLSREQQEWFGRELLEQVDAMSRLRADIEVGLREFDAGLGQGLDIEDVLRRTRRTDG